MAETDIVLGVDFDTSNVKKTAQEVQREFNKFFNSGSNGSGSTTSALSGIEAQVDRLNQKVDQLTEALKNAIQVDTAEANDSRNMLTATVNSLIETLENLAQAPPASVDVIDPELIENETEIVEDVVDDMSDDISGTVSNMVGFIAGLVSGFVSGLVTSAIRLVSRLISKFIQSCKKQVEDIIKFATSGVQTIITYVGKLSKLLTKGFIGLTVKSVQTLFSVIKSIVAKLASLKSIVVENLKLMAKWHHGNNQVNKSLSNITSSLAYLKASLATVVAPILNYIEPVLTRMIDQLAELITLIGMFIAKLTGATTFQKAIRKQKDFAKALRGTKNELASFDELNILGTKDGEAVDFAEMGLEDIDLPEWLKNLDALKKKLFELGQLIGTKVRDWLNAIDWEKIKTGAKGAAEAISAFFDGLFSIDRLGASVGRAIGEIVNTLSTFLGTFFAEMPWANIGKQIGEAFQTMLETISWDNLGELFSGAWNALFEMLYNFFTSWDGKTLGEGLSTLLQNAIGGIDWTLIRGTLIEAVQRLVETLRELITPENFAMLGTALAEALNTIFATLGTITSDVQKKNAKDITIWQQFGESIAAGINSVFEGFDAEKNAETISNLARGLLDMISAAIDKIEWDVVGDKLVEFISNINWSNLANYALTIAQELREALTEIWNELKESDAFGEIIKMIADFLSEKENWEKEFKKIKRDIFWNLMRERFFNWTEDKAIPFLFSGAGKKIAEGILAGFTSLSESEYFKSVMKVLETLVNALRGVFGIHSPAETMNPIGEDIILGILEGFGLVDFIGKVTEWWDTNVQPWFDSIQQNIDLLTDAIGLKMTAFKDSMIDTFRAIKTGIKIPINYIISFVEGMVNKIIDGLNWLIDGLSKVKFDIPDNPVLFGALSGHSFDINLPKLTPITIPRLAQGSVVPPNREFMAMLGDNKKETEVVSPLSTMQEAMVNALQAMGFDGGQPINIYLGTEKIYSEIRKMEKRNVIMGG